MEFNVRHFRQSDIIDVVDAFIDSFIPEVTAKEEFRKLILPILKNLLPSTNYLIVAEEDGTARGFLMAKFKDSKIDIYKLFNTIILCIATGIKYLFTLNKYSKEDRSIFVKFCIRAGLSNLESRDGVDAEILVLGSQINYRKGIGTALLNKFIEDCKKKGVKHIKLLTDTSLSYKFYEKKGFNRIKESKLHILKDQFTAFIYKLDINYE